MIAPQWHVLAVEAVEDQLQTDETRGLASPEAIRRLEQYGPNTLAQAPPRSALVILLAQFQSLIVALLVAATAIAFATGVIGQIECSHRWAQRCGHLTPAFFFAASPFALPLRDLR